MGEEEGEEEVVEGVGEIINGAGKRKEEVDRPIGSVWGNAGRTCSKDHSVVLVFWQPFFVSNNSH